MTTHVEGGSGSLGQFDVMDFLGVWNTATPQVTGTTPTFIVNPNQSNILTASRVLWVAQPAGVSYYFEAALFSDNLATHTPTAELWDTNHTTLVAGSTVSVPTNANTSPFFVRSGAISLVAGIEYAVKIYNQSAGGTTFISAARVIGVR